MDELNGWTPPAELAGADLAILPMGICELDLFTGERQLPADQPMLTAAAPSPETRGIAAAIGARRTLLAQAENLDALSHDDLQELSRRLDGAVEFAWDTLVVEA